MKFTIDGRPQETDCRTLAGPLALLGHGAGAVATAVNGEFVAADERAATPLVEGDAIEIVVPIALG